MYFVDFIFDGIKLSDFGCMVGAGATGIDDSVSVGSVIEFETVVNHGSFLSETVNADYKDVYTATFDVIKKGCSNYGTEFSDREITFFMRWLNRKEYCKFIPIYDDGHSFYRNYMMGSFTECKMIQLGGKVVGMTLTFTSNSPFGYTEMLPKSFNMTSSNNYTFTIYENSDEIGSVYPEKFTITINSIDGNSSALKLSNSLDDSSRYTEIKNVSAGEIITFDCIHKIVTTSKNYTDSSGNEVVGHAAFYNDFNYVYPRLTNTMKSNENVFTSENNIACSVTIEYSQIRKVGALA